MSIRKQFLPSTVTALVILLMGYAAAGKIRAQCCQSQPTSAQPMTVNAGADGTTASAAEPWEWIVDAATKIAAEAKRWFEKMTFVGYSTQWSSWCAGNRAGCGSSQPCSTKGAQPGGKPCDAKMRCCDKPCPTQGAGSGGKSKGSS